MGITREDVGEIIGCVLVFAMWALLAWMFLAATPSQMSAECDALAEEMQTSR